MYLKHDVRRVLVVTVTSALGVWEDQVVAHCPVPYRVYSHDGELLQESRKRPGRYQPPLTFMTVNYQNTFWHGLTGVGREWVPIDNDVLVKFKPQIVIVDECFPGGEWINTPLGKKKVEDLQVDDELYGVDHKTGRVVITKATRIFSRLTDEPLVTINDVTMTYKHPVWTLNRGYVEAQSVRSADIMGTLDYTKENNALYQSAQALQMVQEQIYGLTAAGILQPVLRFTKYMDKSSKGKYQKRKSFKTGKKNGQEEWKRSKRTGQVETIPFVRTQPIQRPNQKRRNQPKGSSNPKSSWLSTAKWGEWFWGYFAPNSFSPSFRLGNRSSGENWKWVPSSSLQNRHCQSQIKGSDRGRWTYPPNQKNPIKGSSQEPLADTKWLEGFSGEKQIGSSSSQESSKVHKVFNIETASGNLFANGLLVHNSHHIGDPTAITSHKIYALAQGAQYRVFMTGTMFHRKPFYVFGQIKFFDDGATFGGAWTHFKNKIAIFGGYGGYEVKGYRNMKWTMDKVRPMVFMQKYVPPRPRVKNVLHFPLTGKGLEVYKEMEKQRALRVKGEIVTAEIVLTLHLRLMQIAGGFVKLPSGKYAQVGNDKIRMAEDRLREYLEQDITKAVVACRFTPELRALARLAKKLKFEPILFHGAVPSGDERKRRIAQFHSTKKPALFISQISAGKEGIDLSCASTTMWYSITESYVEFDQFSRRIELFKDKRTLMDDFLVAKGTRDETALKAMELKMDVADYLMSDPDKVDALLNNGKPSRRR